jgi:membrane associated rhomboid family serine protease
MSEVPITTGNKTEYLDVCTGCFLVWFDTHEYESLPKVTKSEPKEPNLPMEAKEALALAQLEELKRDHTFTDSFDSGPEHWWYITPALFGIPIEYNDTPLQHKPVVTWLLAAMITLVTFISFRDLRYTIATFGLIPAEFTRYFGFTFISSFFLHGGIIHLLGNLYFLIVFGDNAEDVLGRGKYLLLLALATLAGHIAHILGNIHSMIPCVGASGGISGILAYYCLRFPQASVGIIFWFRWIRLPVGYMLAIWILLQLLGVYLQKAELSDVSALAHLGGASVGILFWLLEKKSFSSQKA